MTKDKKNEDIREEDMIDPGEDSFSEVAELEQEVEEELSLEEKFQQTKEEAADLRDKVLRMAADFENYKKRMEREKNTLLKYAAEHILRELLPVVDNLERATLQGIVEGADAEVNLVALLEGVELTLKSLVATLEKFEVMPITSVGEPFDPNKQEALTMEPSDSVPANHVLSEFERGYHYKDRLLRPARVVVSSGKPES